MSNHLNAREFGMLDMHKDTHDDTDACTNNDDSYDVRECAKIRLEDAAAQELVRELSKEFAEFTRKYPLEDQADHVELQSDEGQSQVAQDVGLPEHLHAVEGEGFALKLPLLERLLNFFGEFYERFTTKSVIRGHPKLLSFKERRKKRLLIEALMTILRKLLLRRREKSLSELLNEQIKELVSALDHEQDPALRKVLQERLSLLLQLRMQLVSYRSVMGIEQLIIIIMGSALASATLSLQRDGFSGERSASYSRTMQPLMDMAGLVHGGVAKDMASMQASMMALAGYQPGLDVHIAALLSKSMSYQVSHDKSILPEHFLALHGRNHAPVPVADTAAHAIVAALNQVLKAVANRVLEAARIVVNRAMEIVGGEDAGIARGPYMHARRAAPKADARVVVDDGIKEQRHVQEHHNVHLDFHIQAHVHTEHNKRREERTCAIDELRYDAIDFCAIAKVSFASGVVKCEQASVVKMQASSELAEVSVATVTQQCVEMQILRR
ncbi:hypothetical protein [Anaplasma phagocytophilum]|uniref:Uncharacterized protein n=3 Tax=Anaplasma phagocytophilum TaxID=948 RepID=Q2GKX8_ANAPZ|nr:hypothetical protein [Anaplasma phagocytophilum]ABD43304.1 hypothetical protein APH_0366 [Anaplasma phagocytophilum str. HZ]KJV87924.1 hypothetical protein APHNYW_0344 [Anaplasma phagocytophilum str. ApNYW]